MNKETFEDTVRSFGREIFALIGEEQPSTFNRNGISGKLMEWSMQKPALKVNMFRLVDVLPTLKSARSVAGHAREYLEAPAKDVNTLFGRAIAFGAGPLRSNLTSMAVKFGVHQMAKQFIAGSDAKNALKALKRIRKNKMAYTVDLLGEFSVSEKEALAYVKRYIDALEILGKEFSPATGEKPIIEGHPGEIHPVCVSVKLTALYSQCGPLNFERSVNILRERLSEIVFKAKLMNASVYVDAEDSANNPIIYEVFRRTFMQDEFKDFPYPGIVVQAYSKESKNTLESLISYAKERGTPIAVRLVKGAYWDQETILSQQQDWPSPLFAKKQSTDSNYERLSRILIDNYKHCLPGFGSHNVRSLSHACCYAEEQGLSPADFELQMLYGMADPIAKAFQRKNYLVRFYVPLGEILPGMGYLVRRLLENTSNESFLRHTFFEESHIDTLLEKPNMLEIDL